MYHKRKSQGWMHGFAIVNSRNIWRLETYLECKIEWKNKPGIWLDIFQCWRDRWARFSNGEKNDILTKRLIVCYVKYVIIIDFWIFPVFLFY